METAKSLKEKFIKEEVRNNTAVSIQYGPNDFTWPIFPDEEIEFEGDEVIHFLVRTCNVI